MGGRRQVKGVLGRDGRRSERGAAHAQPCSEITWQRMRRNPVCPELSKWEERGMMLGGEGAGARPALQAL